MNQKIDLTDLREKANDICGEADASRFDEAINWGDLGCVESMLVESDHHCALRVVISEASPEAFEFCSWVSRKLSEDGYEDVEVVSEW